MTKTNSSEPCNPFEAKLAELQSRWSTPDTPQQVAEREARLQAERNDEIRKRWGVLRAAIGSRYEDCSFDTFDAKLAAQGKAVDVLRAFCEDIGDRVAQGVCLTLHGPCGTGKDHLMVACLKSALKAGKTARWVNGADLFGGFRDAIDSNKSEASAVREFLTPDVLAISDPLPPTGDLTSFQRSGLFRILDGRYRARKPVWVTINVADRAELDQRMGTALAERLLDDALVLRCAWPSYRKPMRLGADT